MTDPINVTTIEDPNHLDRQQNQDQSLHPDPMTQNNPPNMDATTVAELYSSRLDLGFQPSVRQSARQ